MNEISRPRLREIDEEEGDCLRRESPDLHFIITLAPERRKKQKGDLFISLKPDTNFDFREPTPGKSYKTKRKGGRRREAHQS